MRYPAPILLGTHTPAVRTFRQTGTNVKFVIMEDRSNEVLVIRSEEGVGEVKELRPIFIDLAALYKIIDPKKTKEPKSGLQDAARDKATSDFVLNRLKVSNGPVALPGIWAESKGAVAVSGKAPQEETAAVEPTVGRCVI